MMGFALGFSLLVLPAFAGEGPVCPKPTTIDDFLGAATRGEEAFAAMDLPTLSEARQEALTVIPCLGEALSMQHAAAFHRMMALAAFTWGDSDGVMREFHAARRLEPGYQIPTAVAPPGHPLLVLYEQSTGADEGAIEATIPPRNGWVTVDGVRGAPRPAGISTLIQVFGPPSSLDATLYLLPGDPLPTWGPLPVDELRRRRRRVTLASATGVSLAASGVLYGLAMRSEARFWDEGDPVPYGELDVAQRNTNALFFTSLGALGLGAGLGVATVVLW